MAGESTLQFGEDRNDDFETKLAVASEQLEDVLETVDLDRDPEFVDAILDAVTATNRAYRLVTDD